MRTPITIYPGSPSGRGSSPWAGSNVTNLSWLKMSQACNNRYIYQLIVTFLFWNCSKVISVQKCYYQPAINKKSYTHQQQVHEVIISVQIHSIIHGMVTCMSFWDWFDLITLTKQSQYFKLKTAMKPICVQLQLKEKRLNILHDGR